MAHQNDMRVDGAILMTDRSNHIKTKSNVNETHLSYCLFFNEIKTQTTNDERIE